MIKSKEESVGFFKNLIKAVLIATAVIYIYTAGFGVFSAMTQRALLLTLLLPISFFIGKEADIKGTLRKRVSSIVNIVLSLSILSSCLYVMMVWDERILKVGPAPDLDIIMGTIMIVILLELARRKVGLSIAVIALVFLGYTVLGPYFPSFLSHGGQTWRRVVEFLYLTTEGIFGIPLGIAATFIIVFVIFGAFLNAFNVGQWFIDVAFSITGKYRGGPAKTAIAASGLMGMISGAPAANVATTGSFTIPLMKETGYKPFYAASIEAVASTAGLFTPPIMGAGAFIMAEYLGAPYQTVALAAVLPSLLFYVSLFITTDMRAKKMELKGLKKEELPNFRKTVINKFYLGLPVIFMITFILVGWSPMKTAFGALVLTLVIDLINNRFKIRGKLIMESLEKGASQTIPIVISCATAGIIVGVISMTGLGAKLSYTLLEVTGGNLVLTGIFVALITLILGCGMPPTAVYIILASILVSPLVEMGVAPIAAHMFIFIYASLGALTPPVAITAYTAAAIAESDPNKTGFTAFKLGMAAYLIPFKFIMNPSILLVGSVVQIGYSCFVVITIILALTALNGGYLIIQWNKLERLASVVAVMLMMIPVMSFELSGIVIFASIFSYKLIKNTVSKNNHIVNSNVH